MDQRYQLNDPGSLLSPSFVLFRDLVEHNVEEMVRIARDPARLRPHCKTHKMVEIVRMQLDRGIVRQKAATIAEAEMLARTGCDDVLLAYNPVGPNIERVARLVEAFPDVRFGVTADDAGMIAALGGALQRISDSIDVVLDINPGRDRTGVPPGEEAVELARCIAETPGTRPGGFHLYDGHQHQSDPAERRAAVMNVWEQVCVLRDQLLRDGIPVPRIVCGGTPTFPIYAQLSDPDIELSPGTCVLHDSGYGDRFPDLGDFAPAALVLTRVVSRPTENRVTFDCGTKSIAADPPMGQRAFFPDLPDAQQVLHNEEHLVLETPRAGEWKPGDWTFAIPKHVCPTTALHRHAYVISHGSLVDQWTVVARDRMLTI